MDTWTAIIPIRSLSTGKSRLSGVSSAEGLVAAFACDVLAACCDCPTISDVLVVSPDPSVISLAQTLNCEGLLEEGAGGINEAVATARRFLGEDRRVVAVLGDTPCVTGEALEMVLACADAYSMSFVADAAGIGSTMWCSQVVDGHSFFGERSRAQHRSAGYMELGALEGSELWARARRDVDTDADLWDALRIGVGPATSDAMRRVT